MYDLVIRNGNIFDGTGAPFYAADVGIKADKIVKIGKIQNQESEKTIDASGLAVSPGFIDIHSHDDMIVLTDPMVEPKLRQGYTTTVGGNCGFSVFPVQAGKEVDFRSLLSNVFMDMPDDYTGYPNLQTYYDDIGRNNPAINFATYIGHSTLRVAAMGYEDRAPTDHEMEVMAGLLRDAMQAGAIGMTFGLTYTPGCYSTFPERLALAKVVAEYGGLVASHIYSESLYFEESVEEMIAIAEGATVPLQISHFQAEGMQYLDKAIPLLRHLENKRLEGIDLTIDAYPYNAGSTGITAMFPPWSINGGVSKLVERLQDPVESKKIRDDILLGEDNEEFERFWRLFGWDMLEIISVNNPENKQWEGMSLEEIGKKQGKHPIDALIDLTISENGRASMITYFQESGNLEALMQSNIHMFMSDGLPTDSGKPHPRLYGTAARILGHFVREKKVLSLEKALSKLTYNPANKAGLFDRGLIRPGMAADLTVFDPRTISERGTYRDPAQFPVGIHHVVCNGEQILVDGEVTGARPGRALRRTS